MFMKKKPLLSLLGAAVVALASVAAPGTPGNNIIEEVAWMVGDQPYTRAR